MRLLPELPIGEFDGYFYQRQAAAQSDRDDPAARQREYGVNMAKKLALRLAALYAADSLADFWPPNSGPERCHELKGDS